jgi:hypothetical protein
MSDLVPKCVPKRTSQTCFWLSNDPRDCSRSGLETGLVLRLIESTNFRTGNALGRRILGETVTSGSWR